MRLLFLIILFLFILPTPSAFAAINLNISNLQTTSDYYSINASVSGIASSSACYVQAMFTAPGDPHYFGSTWSSTGSWFNYQSSPSPDFIKANFVKLENDQPTTILVKPDFADSDYKGTGEYSLKLKRYTGNSSSSAGESNSLTINLAQSTPSPTHSAANPPLAETSTPTLTQTPTSTPTKIPTTTPTPTSTPSKTITPTPFASPNPPSGGEGGTPTPEVLSASVSSQINQPGPISQNLPTASNQPNLYLVGAGLVTTGLSGLLYRFRHLLKKAVK